MTAIRTSSSRTPSTTDARRGSVAEDGAEGDVDERGAGRCSDPVGQDLVAGGRERPGAEELGRRDVRALGGLQAWWVDVEVEMVIHAAVRSRFEPLVSPQRGSGFAGRCDSWLGQQSTEGVAYRSDTESRSDDGSGELGGIVDHEIGRPRPGDRSQIGEQGRSPDRAEQARKHEVRPCRGWQFVDLGEPPVELRHRFPLTHADRTRS